MVLFPSSNYNEFMSTSKNKTSTPITGDIPASLMAAVRKILRPLVRLFLSYRMAFPQLAELLKSVYVEVAEDEFRLPKKPQTDTRLSMLTGIHRKDIKRLRGLTPEEKEAPAIVDIGIRMVSRWIGEAYYQDKEGKPLVLPLKTPKAINNTKTLTSHKASTRVDSKPPSFESLVMDICKRDIRPGVILDEWLNMGVVTTETVDGSQNITLNSAAFIPSKGFDEKAFFLGHNISDHLSASTHNILGHDPAFFERCAYFDSLSEESMTKLNDLVSKKGMETLLAINELAMRLRTQDAINPENTHRINIGIYTYHNEEGKNNE